MSADKGCACHPRSTCTCNPLRPRGCAAEDCLNSGSYFARREAIASKTFSLFLVEAETRCHTAHVTDPTVRYAEASKEATRAATALIAELDRA